MALPPARETELPRYLSEREFFHSLRLWAPTEIPVEILETVARQFVKEGKTRHDDVRLAEDVARMISSFASKAKVKPAAPLIPVFGADATETVLHSKQMMEAVGPSVEAVRRQLFGSARVPFRSLEQAVRWIRGQAAARPARPVPDVERLQRVVLGIVEQLNVVKELTGAEGQVAFGSLWLPFPQPRRKEPGKVPVSSNTPLGELAKATERLADATGCTQAVAVAHVLVGTPLVLEPVRYGVAWGGDYGVLRRTATIEILNPQALTLPVLMKAYSGIRAHLGLTKKKTLSEWHERLLRLVDKRGGVPRRGKTGFWEGIQKEWNRAVPQGRRCFTTWMGPKMAYDRVSAVLKKRRDSTAKSLLRS